MKTNKSSQGTPNQGFTLIELLTVITIIIVLAGLSMGAFSWANRKAIKTKAETQMRLLENGIQQYYADAGSYPKARGNGGAAESLLIYRMCFGDGIGDDGVVGGSDRDPSIDGIPDEGATIYLSELDPNAGGGAVWFQGKTRPRALYDPWGKPWYYRSGQSANINPDFDLWSAGADGRTSARANDYTKDDLTNW